MTDKQKQQAVEGALLGLVGMGILVMLGGFKVPVALKYTFGATLVGAGAGWLHAKTTEDIAGLFKEKTT